MFLKLELYSKNKNSYKKILNFLVLLTNNLKEFPIYITRRKAKNSKKKYTILKSPHVNKIAQEQFEIRKYKSYFEIYSYSNLFLLLVLKQITKKLYKDINITVKIYSNNKKFLKMLKSNTNNNSLFLLRDTSKSIEGYLKLLDNYGEIYFLSLDSSVG